MSAAIVAPLVSIALALFGSQDEPAQPQKKDVLQVVATHPALASIAEQVGAGHVAVTTLCKPTGDVHSVDPTPALFARLADADVLVHSGLDLEMWLEDAVNGARNPALRAGKPGNVDCSNGIALLNVPANPSRADGDVHIYGNPHYWTDPLNGIAIAATIAAGFSAVDPARAAEYAAAKDRFCADVKKRLLGWLKEAIPFKNTPIVCFHDSFPYFVRRFGFQVVAFLEPKPRIPPTQSHLQSVLDVVKERGVKVIVREPFHDPVPAQFVADKTGAKVVVLSTMPGGIENSVTYQDLIDRDLHAILEALK